MGNHPLEKCQPHQHSSLLIPSWPRCSSWSLLLAPANPCTKRWPSSITRCSKISKRLPPPTMVGKWDILGSSWIQPAMLPIMVACLSHRLTSGIIHGSPLLPHPVRKIRPWHAINRSCWNPMNTWPSWFAVPTNSKRPSMKIIWLNWRMHTWALQRRCQKKFLKMSLPAMWKLPFRCVMKIGGNSNNPWTPTNLLWSTINDKKNARSSLPMPRNLPQRPPWSTQASCMNLPPASWQQLIASRNACLTLKKRGPN